MIVQIGVSDISRFNLEQRLLGKFSFLVDGRPKSFYKNREAAESAFGKQIAYELRRSRRTKVNEEFVDWR